MDHSPYLDRPLVPLAVALPRMLARVEADLATAGPQHRSRLRERAELIRGVLTSTQRTGRTEIRPGSQRA